MPRVATLKKEKSRQHKPLLEDQMSDLAEKDCTTAFLNMFTELEDSIIKEVKEDVITMSHQIKNSNKET